MFDLSPGKADQFIGQPFSAIVHEGDAWTLASWWNNGSDCESPKMGLRSHCRIGNAERGWQSLELTLAHHWAGEKRFEVIFGRNTAAIRRPIALPAAEIVMPQAVALMKNAAVLRRERVKRKWAERNVRRLAYQDHLTGLINRTYFHLRLKNTLRHAQRFDRSVVLLVIDLDHFKDINERVGSKLGDKLLQLAA